MFLRTIADRPSGYEAFLRRRPGGGGFGIYEVIYAYLEIREKEEYLRSVASEEAIKSDESTWSSYA
jgi:hypothetical protein